MSISSDYRRSYHSDPVTSSLSGSYDSLPFENTSVHFSESLPRCRTVRPDAIDYRFVDGCFLMSPHGAWQFTIKSLFQAVKQ